MAGVANRWLVLALLSCLAACEASLILIKGGTVVNHDQKFLADVFIEGDTIKAIGQNLAENAAEQVHTIDASGMYVMPGGIDPHTHLEMPFMGQVACDDFFSGQAAALAGGTTMHIDFALPVDNSLVKGLETWQAKAAKGCMDYGLHMAITKWTNQSHAEMEQLTQQGVNSFKFFMAYKGAFMVNDEQMLSGFEACKRLGALPMVHAENGEAIAWQQQRLLKRGITGPEGHALSRPSVLEGEATGRAIRLARFANVPLYVVHVMSIDALNEVAAAKKEGQRVIGEPVASGLSMNESWMWHPDFDVAAKYVMSPPIRGAEHQLALKKALAAGVLQVVATDHAVFNSTQKAAGRDNFMLIPNGVNGIEERLHVVWQELVVSGLMTPSDFVRVTSTAAAQTFNIFPRKGLLAAGSDADVIVFDPNKEHVLGALVHHSCIDTSIYEGKKVKGQVVVTISRGRVVWDHGKLNVQPHSSRFVPMPTFGSLFEGLDVQDMATATMTPYGSIPVDRSAQLQMHVDEGRHACAAGNSASHAAACSA